MYKIYGTNRTEFVCNLILIIHFNSLFQIQFVKKKYTLCVQSLEDKAIRITGNPIFRVIEHFNGFMNIYGFNYIDINLKSF